MKRAGESLEMVLGRLALRTRRLVRPVNIDLDCHPKPLPQLRPAVTTGICRIVQEAVINAGKHSDCRTVVIRVVAEAGAAAGPGTLSIEIRDDGRPCDQGFGGSGIGLTGIRERAIDLGGSAQIGPLHDGGWRVCVRLPLERSRIAQEPAPSAHGTRSANGSHATHRDTPGRLSVDRSIG